MTLKADMKKAISNMLGEQEKIVKGTILSTCSRIIKRTPVDTGRLRGNWQASINTEASGQLSKTDISGGSTINEASNELSRLKVMKDVYMLTNNLPYAAIIENGDGAKRTPHGMMRISVAETNAAIAAGRKL